MLPLINPQLTQLLACPDCKNDLSEIDKRLICNLCKRKYEIKNGIPILYPSNLDYVHLREEENLAKMMNRPRLNIKDQFSSIQWKNSKNEFWNIVQDNIRIEHQVFINIGCGYDNNFNKLEQKTHIFVNFDMVYDMVYFLKKNFDAKFCVVGDMNALPFRKNSFDCVSCIDVIHHESCRLWNLLESFKGILKLGGYLFLEDMNAWGLFQFPKSIFIPKPLFRILRSIFHRLKHSNHKPANYEFATNPWKVKKTLERLRFHDIKFYLNKSYPNINEFCFYIYKFLSKIELVQKYHNCHYFLSAIN